MRRVARPMPWWGSVQLEPVLHLISVDSHPQASWGRCVKVSTAILPVNKSFKNLLL